MKQLARWLGVAVSLIVTITGCQRSAPNSAPIETLQNREPVAVRLM
ncbi:hypothetical protein HRbin36_00927 [bacterium HR36]|nr:hypothetical protein HRbin36_00927 [bacterium HR36]